MNALTIINKIRQSGIDRPDTYYSKSGDMCYYTDGLCSDQSQGCIFGQALIELDKDGDFRSIIDDNNYEDIVSLLDRLVGSGWVETPTPEQYNWWESVQIGQDLGQSGTKAKKEAG